MAKNKKKAAGLPEEAAVETTVQPEEAAVTPDTSLDELSAALNESLKDVEPVSEPENEFAEEFSEQSPEDSAEEIIGTADEPAEEIPAEEKPKLSARPSYPQYALATQLLGILVNQYSTRRGISPRLVSTTTDVRQAIAAREGTLPASETPRLLTGWRAKFLDDFIGDCLDGRFAMRFSNDLESLPLQLIDRQASRR